MEIKIHQIIRSRRRTIGLQITAEANLIIRAPYRVSMGFIKKIVREKEPWITKKLQEVGEKHRSIEPKKFSDGEQFLFIGEKYPLKMVEELDVPLLFAENHLFLANKNREKAEQIFTHWYREMALQIITKRVDLYAKNFRLKHTKIRVSNAQKRWGSCSSKNSLRFAWKLIMAPLPVIDYVVIHELSHLEHKNHSRKFWTSVQTIMPEYKKCEKWLKKNGHTLTL